MSLIAHAFLPRSMFDMESWFRPITTSSLGGLAAPTTLDIFDPFDDLDRVMSKNLMWLDKPAFLDFSCRQPRVPKKYRVSLDCHGFNPESIKNEVKDNKLIVTGCEGNQAEQQDADFSMRQFRKSYELPEGVETDKLVSFMTSNGKLIVEMPIKQKEKAAEGSQVSPASGLPQIVENDKGDKSIQVRISLPQSIDPSKVSVTCKDRDLIVKAENVEEKEDARSQTFYYQRIALPEATDFESLKCAYDNNQLAISAPLHNEPRYESKQVPIEFKASAPANSKSNN